MWVCMRKEKIIYFLIIHTKGLTYLSINGISQSIHHTAKQLLADRYIHNSTSPLHDVTFLDELVITENHNTNVVGLQVQRHALGRKKVQFIEKEKCHLQGYDYKI